MKNKRRFLVITLSCLFLFAKNVFGAEAFTIEKYHIDIVVNLDNSYDIKEQLLVDFEYRRHGIIRKVPYNSLVKRTDGTSVRKIASINKIKVNNKKSVSADNYYKHIKIGDPNREIIGSQFYEIQYKYNIGDDRTEEFDEFYFNLIGPEWDTTINNVSFSINMPKDFDHDKVGFSYGEYGEAKDEDITYDIKDNVISGTLNTMLNPYEGLTIRIELEEGYYNKIKPEINIFLILSFILPIFFLIYVYLMWSKHSKSEKPVDVVEFYPPNDINSIDLAYNYKGKLSEKDVVSLLIYLANKGFISIKETTAGKLFKKKSFELTKLKDYDLDNKQEKTFMNGLFKTKNVVTEQDLAEKFYTTITSITRSVNTTKNKKTIFDLTYNTKKIHIFVLAAITLVLSSLGIYIKYGVITHREIYDLFPIYKYIKIYALIMTGLLALFLFFKPKRNEKGLEILGKINGFKHFLENAEKDKLEELVESDPQYFYNILPYTYVLGVSSVWIKKFESIIKTPPDWYEGTSAFDMYVFSNFMNTTYQSAQSSMVKRPPSEGGGGFSGGGFGGGGGFSGGGSGGGGGSSW